MEGDTPQEPATKTDAEDVVTDTSYEVAGVKCQSAVLGNQYNTKKTIHLYSNQTAQTSVAGQFNLSPGIIVYERNPISPQSRIFRGKLLSKVVGDREIAIKFLQYNERNLREAKIHFSVPHHENIVERIFTDTFSYRGQLTIYIAMECCDNQNLREHVTSQAESGAPFDAPTYLSFAFQVANGMSFLHRHNVINRDVKPENILLAHRKTKVKIADFGLSKQLSGEKFAVTQSNRRAGTDGWRAPEVLKLASHVSKKCDIFPMGLVFNFIWSYGKHPFGDDPDSWNHYIKRGENCNLDQLLIPNPEAAKALLTRMLQVDPDLRPTAEEVLVHPIFSTLDSSVGPEIGQVVDEFVTKMDDVNLASESNQNSAGDGGISLTKSQLLQVVKEVMAKTRSESLKPVDFPVPTDDWELPEDEVKIGEKIAGGGYGQINKGYFKQVVAVKTCNLSDVCEESRANEAEMLKNLQHENIIRFIGVVRRTRFTIVLEYAEYGPLLRYLQKNEGKRITFDEKVTMAAQVAAGMAHVERKRCIHRQLRSAFILVGKYKVCKISSFGRARYLGDVDECKIPLAVDDRPQWMAPETMDERRFSIKTDVWSFGVLISEILTNGQVPYFNWTDRHLKSRIKNGERMAKQSNWPSKIYDGVMLKCWAHQPEVRPSFSQLEKILKDFFAE